MSAKAEIMGSRRASQTNRPEISDRLHERRTRRRLGFQGRPQQHHVGKAFRARATCYRRFSASAISFAPLSGTDQFAVFFGDLRANAYAVNALTGALVWKTKVEDHPAALITGAPTLYSGILYVPVSSMEEVTGSPSAYQCCTFRGSVVALDIATGKQIWKGYTIPEAPRPTKRNAVGTQLYGPSGAAVWSAPTIGCQRQASYVATGANDSYHPSGTGARLL